MPRKPLELQSLKWPFVGLAVLLALSSIWAVYDEVVPRSPWKNYQRVFFKLEESHLKAAREQAQMEQYWISKLRNSWGSETVDRGQNCHVGINKGGFSAPWEVLEAKKANLP